MPLELAPQALDRHRPVEPQVAGAVDHRHPPLPQLPLEQVAVARLLVELENRLPHRRPATEVDGPRGPVDRTRGWLVAPPLPLLPVRHPAPPDPPECT